MSECVVCGEDCDTIVPFHIHCPSRRRRKEATAHEDCVVAWFRSGHKNCPCQLTKQDQLTDESDFDDDGLSLRAVTKEKVLTAISDKPPASVLRVRAARAKYKASLKAARSLKEEKGTLYSLKKKKYRAQRAIDDAQRELREAARRIAVPSSIRIAIACEQDDVRHMPR